MTKAYVFPGQGSQFPGMAKDLYQNPVAKEWMESANEILGFRITDIMFDGSAEDLKETHVTQPAIFLHSVVQARVLGDAFQPDMVAGHSLGEFSALVAADAMSFEDGLTLVQKRARAMQKACEINPSTMSAIIGLSDNEVEYICSQISDDVVVPANYNCPGQIVISGTKTGVERANGQLREAGAKRALLLSVSGGFHSPMMDPARKELQAAIENTAIGKPDCLIYQNVTARPTTDPDEISINLIAQLTSPVLWTQTVINMIEDGADEFIEVGPGKVLQGLIRKVNSSVETNSA